MKIRSLFLLLAVSCIGITLAAKEIPPRPDQLVNDYAGILSRDEWQKLEGKLRAYNDSSSTQIAIVIDKTLEDEDDFAAIGKKSNVFSSLSITINVEDVDGLGGKEII
jgi:uncharacterized protein